MAAESLASRLECLPMVRKRFRKGVEWIREPGEAAGENCLQTTKALELNYPILRVVISWMPTRKLSIHDLEPEAIEFQSPLQDPIVFRNLPLPSNF